MAKVFIIMGSKSAFPIAEKAIKVLNKFGVAYDIAVASAHRTPQRVEQLVTGTDAGVFISIAGLSAALPGVIASFTTKPVIGVPVESGTLLGMDALLSTAMMPPGVPVASVGINGDTNAALLAARIISANDSAAAGRLQAYADAKAQKVRESRQDKKIFEDLPMAPEEAFRKDE